MAGPGGDHILRFIAKEEHDQVCSTLWPMYMDPAELASIQKVWYDQGFEFSAMNELHCFFVQRANGPCGILSGIQALLIQELLFPAAMDQIRVPPSMATIQQRNQAFANGMAQCLFQAAGQDGKPCLITTMPNVEKVNKQLPSDMLMENSILAVHEPPTVETLAATIVAHMELFENPHGVMLFLYSLVLSRGVANIRSDTNMGLNCLIFEDGCCEQALVNLLLTGQARIPVDDDAWASWKGYTRVGFLTSMKEYDPAACFKNPAYPVWITHGGGHYTVMWCPNQDVLTIPATAPNTNALLIRQPTGRPRSQSMNVETDDADLADRNSTEGSGHVAKKLKFGDGSQDAQEETDTDDDEAELLRQAIAMSLGSLGDDSTAAPDEIPDEEPPPLLYEPLPALTMGETRAPSGGFVSLEDEQLAAAIQASLQDVSGSGNGRDAASNQPERSSGDAVLPARDFEFYHYNGLHPLHCDGVPIRVAKFTMDLSGNAPEDSSVTPEEEERNLARKIARVLDHRPVDGASKETGPWEFLVVCRPDGSMEGVLPKPTTKWRCRDCYLKDEIVWSAFNEPVHALPRPI